ncbi:MAG: siphovirus Gp157 family protein [Oscillospiraceae bacterium]|nr:siphovirus Gp157 family protein [Oscillospiraceae bacterium]
MSTLYELSNEFKYVYDMLSQGEIDDNAFNDTLEGINFKDRFEEKADGYAKIIAMVKADAAAADAESKRLSERKKAFENNAERMRRRLFEAMKMTGNLKFKTALFSFSVSKSPPSIQIDDGAKIPKKYYVSKAPEISKSLLKEAIASGAKIKGVSLVQSEKLTIK